VVSCQDKSTQAIAKKNALGSVKQSVPVTNITVARTAAKSLYTSLKTDTVVTEEIYAIVTGTEKAVFDQTLFTNYGNDQQLLDHIKTIVCGSASDTCSISGVGEGRRQLRDLATSIAVTITYSIDSSVFDSLNGTTFNDGGTFEQELAAALGVTTNDISILTTDGTLEIEYIVAQEATGDDPLTESNIAALNTVNSELSTITSTVNSQLGTTASTPTVDKCGDRTCNGRGTCNPTTGVCACSTTDYWGVNCETAVSCNGGVKLSSSAYCSCEYPNYGLRCQSNIIDVFYP
jgi:hypothetical protein